MHVISEYSIEPALGLIFGLNGRQAFITCDTQFASSQIKAYYEKADVIFHDCETVPHKSGAHARFEYLKTLPAGQKAKMRLCHYQDGAPPDAQGLVLPALSKKANPSPESNNQDNRSLRIGLAQAGPFFFKEIGFWGARLCPP